MKHSRSLILAAAFALLLSGHELTAAQTLPPRQDIKTFQLGNGLRIVALEDHSVPIINLQVWYHVGSKDEQPGSTGFAHLFEHLMFKGSAHVGPDDYARMIQDIGGDANAHTLEDYTYFDQTFPSSYLERVMWMEADRMHSLRVDQFNFASEREVVKEERRTRIDNVPYGRVTEIIRKNAFPGAPYGHVVIGSMEDLNQASLSDVQEFYQAFYRPNNAVVVIVGDFDTTRALRLARKHFGRIPARRGVVPRLLQRAKTNVLETRFREYDSRIQLPAVVRAYYAPKAGDSDRYALEIASNLLFTGQSSKLYRELVYKKQIALAIGGGGNFFEDAGLFYAFAVVGFNRKVEDCEAALDEALEDLRQKPVGDDDLKKAKTQIVATLIFDRQRVGQRCNSIGQASLLLGNPQAVNDEVAKYLAVTAADVRRVMQDYLKPANRVVVTILPAAQNPERH